MFAAAAFPALSLAGTVLSAGIGAIGAMSAASAQKAQAEYQAQVARNNQLIAEQNARASVEMGETRAQAESFKSRAAGAAAEVGQASSGIALESPSLQDVRRSQASLGRLNVENVMQQARLQAYGYESQATNYGAQAGLYSMVGRQASTAGFLGAAGSLLTGATSFADKWARFSNVGLV